MQLSSPSSRPTSFQRQIGAVVDQLTRAETTDRASGDPMHMFAAIEDAGLAVGRATNAHASPDARLDAEAGVDKLGLAHEVMSANWDMFEPHVSDADWSDGMTAYHEGISLLRQAIGEA